MRGGDSTGSSPADPDNEVHAGSRFDGRVAIVTGGSRGIGRAVAELLARSGARVAILARHEPQLRDAADSIRSEGGEVISVRGDLALPRDRERTVSEVVSSFGRIDYLVSNATAEGTESADADAWDALYAVDLRGGIELARLAAASMRQHSYGAIVFVSSVMGRVADGSEHGYTAMKAALVAAAKSLSLELAPAGIRVNSIAPGTIDFPGSWIDRLRRGDPARVEAMTASLPYERFGTPEEVARVIGFLLSDSASWIIGQCLVVDGGESRCI